VAAAVGLPADARAGARQSTIRILAPAQQAGGPTLVVVQVYDLVPPGLDFQSASSGFTYDPAERLITWSIGPLAPGESRVLTYTAIVTQADALENLACVVGRDDAGIEADACDREIITPPGVPTPTPAPTATATGTPGPTDTPGGDGGGGGGQAPTSTPTPTQTLTPTPTPTVPTGVLPGPPVVAPPVPTVPLPTAVAVQTAVAEGTPIPPAVQTQVAITPAPTRAGLPGTGAPPAGPVGGGPGPAGAALVAAVGALVALSRRGRR
jgi:hypothetical protein